jgi:Class II Aldolase and Adducin N-terminal domain
VIVFDYSYKPNAEDLVVILACEPGAPYGPELEATIAARARSYGFTFAAHRDGLPPHVALAPATIRLLIHCLPRGFSWPAVERAASLLDTYSTVSLAFWYGSIAEMLEAEPRVREAKSRWGDRLNFLRPDDITERGVTVSVTKLADNAVCDTIRIKYVPLQRSAEPPRFDARTHEYLDLASSAYRRHGLFHRSETDGYFAVRVGASFAVTATKTSKVALDHRRVAVVHTYDEAANVLEYSGPYLPSSDAVEASIVFRTLPDVQYLYHTHASRLFTRNPSFRHWIGAGRLPYGEPALGHALAAAIARAADDCTIMEEHGEVFFGRRDESPAAFFGKVERYCDLAAGTLTTSQAHASVDQPIPSVGV